MENHDRAICITAILLLIGCTSVICISHYSERASVAEERAHQYELRVAELQARLSAKSVSVQMGGSSCGCRQNPTQLEGRVEGLEKNMNRLMDAVKPYKNP